MTAFCELADFGGDSEGGFAVVGLVGDLVGDPFVEAFAVGGVAGPEGFGGVEAFGVDELGHGHAEGEDFTVAFGDADAG